MVVAFHVNSPTLSPSLWWLARALLVHRKSANRMTVAFKLGRVRDSGSGSDSEGCYRKVKSGCFREVQQSSASATDPHNCARPGPGCSTLCKLRRHACSSLLEPTLREFQEILLLNTLARMSSAHQLWLALLIILSSNYLDGENLIRVLRYF